MRTLLAAVFLWGFLLFPAKADYLLTHAGTPPMAGGGGGGPALDGSPAFSVASNTVTLTTPSSSDVIILEVGGTGVTGTGTVTDVAGLTWTRRVSTTDGSSRLIEEYWAVAPSPLSSDVITYNDHGAIVVNGLIALGIKGANTSTPFDTNVSLPAITNGTTATPTATGVSTSNAADFLIAGVVGQGSGTPTAGSPFTLLYGSAAAPVVAGEYDVVSTTQSGITVTLPIAGTSSWAFFVDAVQ